MLLCMYVRIYMCIKSIKTILCTIYLLWHIATIQLYCSDASLIGLAIWYRLHWVATFWISILVAFYQIWMYQLFQYHWNPMSESYWAVLWKNLWITLFKLYKKIHEYRVSALAGFACTLSNNMTYAIYGNIKIKFKTIKHLHN